MSRGLGDVYKRQMNNKAQLIQAMEDFRAGRLGTIPADGLRPYRPTR